MRRQVQKSILVLAIGLFMFDPNTTAANSPIYRYVITETAGPNSLDPLDADQTSNLPVARMIYATPLETSESNQLSSRVLESFQYDQSTRQIEWLVKSGLKFEDGTAITPDDVVFAVSRMAYTRPQFPVIDAIEGVHEWAKEKDTLKTLPKGIKLSGNKITIQLTRDLDHPLFRFCLELFSIIPRKCVDTTTNKVICQKIPESGPYRIASQNTDSIQFNRRLPRDVETPEQIRFEYVSSADLLKHIPQFDDKTVVAGNESFFTPAILRELERKLSVRYTPAARFSVLQINQNVVPFSDKRCRQIFAKEFRAAYREVAKDALIEGSIFTKILPGYLSFDELGSSMSISAKDLDECKKKLMKSDIPWGYAETEKDLLFFDVLKLTFQRLGIKPTKTITVPTRKEFSDLFATGKVAFFNAGSGFWALDPGGDMKMLFTLNLHKPLRHVSEDSKLQKFISRLEEDKSAYADVNRYLFDEARFNVYAHLRRFFAAKDKTLIGEVPFAITSPAPWQVFKVK